MIGFLVLVVCGVVGSLFLLFIICSLRLAKVCDESNLK